MLLTEMNMMGKIYYPLKIFKILLVIGSCLNRLMGMKEF